MKVDTNDRLKCKRTTFTWPPVSVLPDATKRSKLNASNASSGRREFRRDSRVPTTLSSLACLRVFETILSVSLPRVDDLSVLPCKLHRIACCDVSQLSVLFSSSLLYDRVIRQENAGLLFSLAVVHTDHVVDRSITEIFPNNAVLVARVLFPFLSICWKNFVADILSKYTRVKL